MLFIGLVLMATACGGSESGNARGGQEELEEVSLRLGFFIDSTVAPYYLAQEQGYYEEEGLEVEILAGRGSPLTAELVGRGRDTFGQVNANAAIEYIQGGGNLLIVSALDRQFAAALIYRTDEIPEIQAIEDLRGQTVITSAGSTYRPALLELLERNNMSEDAVNWNLADFAAHAAIFRRDEKAIQLGGVDSEAIEFEQIDPNLTVTPLSDFGYINYGPMLVSQVSTAKESPEIVEGFVKATLKGWQDSIEDPQAAVEALASQEPDLAADVTSDHALAALEARLSLVETPSDPELPLGCTSPSDWDEILNSLNLEFEIPHEEYYTNEFVGAECG